MQMAKQQKRTYTDEERAEALRLYEEHGPGEASRRMHIPAPTIASWARRAGIQTDAAPHMAAAVEMARLTREQKQETLTDAMLDEAIRTVLDMNRPITVAGAFEPVELPKPDPKSKKELAQTLAVLFEKVQLATGGATSRTETVGKDETASFMLGARAAFEVAEEREAAKP